MNDSNSERSVGGHSFVLFVFHSCTCLPPVHRSINCIKMLLRNKTTRPFRIERMQSSSVYIKKRQWLPSGKKFKKKIETSTTTTTQKITTTRVDYYGHQLPTFQGNQRPKKLFKFSSCFFEPAICILQNFSTLGGHLRR
jgi:hypothetical protein